MSKKPAVVGWRERIDLPEWGIYDLVAKVDTGARTSSIHVEDLQHLDANTIAFKVVLNRRKGAKVAVECPVHRTTMVKSSNGITTERIVVRTRLNIGGLSRVVDLNRSHRPKMSHRMLIGRTSLKGILVNSSQEFLHSTLAM